MFSRAILALKKLLGYTQAGPSNSEQLITLDETEMTRITIEETTSSIKQPTPKVSAGQIASKLGSIYFAAENRPRLLLATLLTLTETGMNFLSPYIFGQVIQSLSAQEETINIGGIEFTRESAIAALVASYSLSQLVPTLRGQLFVPVNLNNTKKLIFESTDHLLKKSLDYHVNTPFPDQVFLIQKSFAVSSLSAPFFTQVMPILIQTIIACSLISVRYGVEMGAGIFALLTCYTAYSGLTVKPIIKSREESLKKGNEAYENFCSALAQYKTMRDFDKYDQVIASVDAAINNMIKADINASLKPLQFSMGHIAIARITMLLSALYVGLGIESKKYSVQDLILIVGYLNNLSFLLPSFGYGVNQLFASIPDVKFVVGELTKPDEVIDMHPHIPLTTKNDAVPAIEFKQVTFTYASNKGKTPAFSDLSFQINSGKVVAFVSESGAGKTTIFNLLYGYYKPDTGTIEVNGADVSQISSRSLQQEIGLIGQNPNLFKGTIRENILYGAPNSTTISDEKIYELAEQIKLGDFIRSFPDGLDTDVGENGKKLSGGQQQKVAILRGLMKPCTIRLLDEITAPFDSKSAKEILTNLLTQSKDKTTLMITHKLTEAQLADIIMVIKDGKVINSGTHDELLTTCELYQKLWNDYLSQAPNEQSPSLPKFMGP